MRLAFTKMQGLGNDFMVINAIETAVHLTAAQIQAWSNRYTGVGFDQLLLLGKSQHADFSYRIFNADGSEVAQCGNGARCIGRFITEKGLSTKLKISLETKAGILYLWLKEPGTVSVDMGVPNFVPEKVPYLPELLGRYANCLQMVSLGNPHAVWFDENFSIADIEEQGQLLSTHPAFPEGINVGFAQKISANTIRLRVYERGAGLTLACGSGACAAVAIGREFQQLEAQVEVIQPGGSLVIRWPGEGQSLWMTGPAHLVYEGEIFLAS